ncbi:hypothetical protein SUGI_0010780 [Cryptomeria japonica]|uniref:protein RETICULATA-RELATED 1, chloroplastic n=1 Tax=Cryptomeria japonica TaxID=3369 RepID=UPI00240897D5|nr:protein RETICULATA-RELATED 1, chloroplastic [Cryptomeria japonica]XP_057831092.2 protein RETICULATA-RELATED 1, chloroplastic [Cryptomeria japonica]XP_057831093.2 protein RETICULATA-RELATED 1, chloroplastic [Cryptomeria japonica]GLJ05090.1 hypothetical protein SUGI_0010780 [Cryptomeria japonica]
MAGISAGIRQQSSVISTSEPSNLPSCLFNAGRSTHVKVRGFPVSKRQGNFQDFSKKGVTFALILENEKPLWVHSNRFESFRSKANSIESGIHPKIVSFERGRHHWVKRGRCHIARCEMDFDSKFVDNPEVVTTTEMAGGGPGLPKLSIVTDGDIKNVLNTDGGAGGNNFGGDDNGNFRGGRGEGGDNEGNQDGNDDESEFGPMLSAAEVFKEAKSRGVVLPSDMAEAARSSGLRKLLLSRYLNLQEAVWPLGAAIRASSMLRNRMLADPSFLFKVSIEIVIDSCCATFAEVQKRGKDFWSEFELYLADLIVGVVVDVVLVCMLAPFVRFGQPTRVAGLSGMVNHAIGALPSSVFEAEMPGRRFSVQQRIGTYFYKGIQYGAVGFGCGIIGQGIANSIMTLKRKLKKSEEHDVAVPPLIKSAALWGVFLAVSSNSRYQIVNGLERVVESSILAKRVPLIALAFTVGVRFANNVYGGMQFVDWARWSGVQ